MACTSLSLLAFTAAATEKCEIPDAVKQAVIHRASTRELLKMKANGIDVFEILGKRPRFYKFYQGNPGDDTFSFFTPDVSNLTVIEALSAEEANAKAESFGIRFTDGHEVARWTRVTEDEVDIDTEPMNYDYPGSTYIHFMDGTMERHGACRPAGSYDYYEFWDSYNRDFTLLPGRSGLSLILNEDYAKIGRECYGDRRIPPQYLNTNE